MLSSPPWCGCGGGNGFIHPLWCGCGPCIVAVVDSGFIHTMWCGCGAGNGHKASQAYLSIVHGLRFRVQGWGSKNGGL